MQITEQLNFHAESLTEWPWEGIPLAQAGYLAAVERIEHNEDPANEWWMAPHDETLVGKNYGLLIGPDAQEMTPKEAREFAYELLVLADIAESELAKVEREQA